MDHLTERALTILRREGRASYSEIARRLGTTRAHIAARITPLLEEGSLRVVAATHPRLLGLHMQAHVSLRVQGPVDALIASLSSLRSSVFVSETSGPAQIVAELHTASLEELHDEAQKIRRFPGVHEVQVLLYEKILSSFFLGEEPEQPAHPLDAHDLRIMEQLQVDGRTGYVDLARDTGLSTSAVRSRVSRLLSSGVMQIGIVRGRESTDSELVLGMGCSISGDLDPLLGVLTEVPGLEFLARTVGRFDAVATLAFPALSDFNRLLARVRQVPGVQTVEYWLHTRIHQERYVQDAGG